MLVRVARKWWHYVFFLAPAPPNCLIQQLTTCIQIFCLYKQVFRWWWWLPVVTNGLSASHWHWLGWTWDYTPTGARASITISRDPAFALWVKFAQKWLFSASLKTFLDSCCLTDVRVDLNNVLQFIWMLNFSLHLQGPVCDLVQDLWYKYSNF